MAVNTQFTATRLGRRVRDPYVDIINSQTPYLLQAKVNEEGRRLAEANQGLAEQGLEEQKRQFLESQAFAEEQARIAADQQKKALMLQGLGTAVSAYPVVKGAYNMLRPSSVTTAPPPPGAVSPPSGTLGPLATSQPGGTTLPPLGGLRSVLGPAAGSIPSTGFVPSLTGEGSIYAPRLASAIGGENLSAVVGAESGLGAAPGAAPSQGFLSTLKDTQVGKAITSIPTPMLNGALAGITTLAMTGDLGRAGLAAGVTGSIYALAPLLGPLAPAAPLISAIANMFVGGDKGPPTFTLSEVDSQFSQLGGWQPGKGIPLSTKTFTKEETAGAPAYQGVAQGYVDTRNQVVTQFNNDVTGILGGLSPTVRAQVESDLGKADFGLSSTGRYEFSKAPNILMSIGTNYRQKLYGNLVSVLEPYRNQITDPTARKWLDDKLTERQKNIEMVRTGQIGGF